VASTCMCVCVVENQSVRQVLTRVAGGSLLDKATEATITRGRKRCGLDKNRSVALKGQHDYRWSLATNEEQIRKSKEASRHTNWWRKSMERERELGRSEGLWGYSGSVRIGPKYSTVLYCSDQRSIYTLRSSDVEKTGDA